MQNPWLLGPNSQLQSQWLRPSLDIKGELVVIPKMQNRQGQNVQNANDNSLRQQEKRERQDRKKKQYFVVHVPFVACSFLSSFTSLFFRFNMFQLMSVTYLTIGLAVQQRKYADLAIWVFLSSRKYLEPPQNQRSVRARGCPKGKKVESKRNQDQARWWGMSSYPMSTSNTRSWTHL